MREIPRPYQVYKHFKGAYYQIICVADHSETQEKLVIYRPLFEESDHVCARPLEMFLSEVDHEKYPDVKQKWRFALATGPVRGSKPEPDTDGSGTDERDTDNSGTDGSGADERDTDNRNPDDGGIEEDSRDEAEDPGEKDAEGNEENSFLDRFLDADTYEKKMDVFTGMWKTIEEQDIDNAALVMDIQLNGETVEEKYKEILNCLKMRARYESTRLR